jgi:secreted PhoX family phosphatase
MTRTFPNLAGALLATTLLTPCTTMAQDAKPGLTRFATVPVGAEVTGMYLTENGDLFFNAQHPAGSNAAPYDRATIGGVIGYDMNRLPKSFEGLAVPQTDAEKQVVQVALGSYQIIGKAGDFEDVVPGGIGAVMSHDGSRRLLQSNDPDFNAYIPVTSKPNEGYLFTNWEDRPGGMSRIRIRQADDGSWQVVDNDAIMIDFSAVGGTWVNCFGSVSPWNTPLTSEELYFDDTADWNNPEYEDHQQQLTLAEHVGHYPNPYDYGYIVEIVDPAGMAMPVKHYSLGRFSHENAVVMPDSKTVYLSDDGSGVVFFKFVAHQPGNLGAGTLYAAKVAQDEGTDPATVGFDVEWIELASGDNATIARWIETYDDIGVDDFEAGETSYISDDEVAAWARREAADDRVAFLESRKAAAAKGATAEFRKMEGVIINQAAASDRSEPFMYLAMSEINETMSDREGDIQLDQNDCGVVYRMELDESYDVSRMEPVVAGGPHDPNAEVDQCATDNIANPDNVLVMQDGRVLIGEDTGAHENNVLWVWDPRV